MQPKYSKAEEQDQEDKRVTNYTQLKSKEVLSQVELVKERPRGWQGGRATKEDSADGKAHGAD